MTPVVWTFSALADVEGIRRYIGNFNPTPRGKWPSGQGGKALAHSAVPNSSYIILANAGLSPQPGSGRNFLLHGESARPALEFVGNANRRVPRRGSTGARPHAVSNRCVVVLPEHMHCLWTLPQGDADFPGRWRAIKIAFSKSLPVCEPRSAVMTRRGERGIWQRRYWEHTIRDDRDFAVYFDYIHFNPVKPNLNSFGGFGR